MTNAKDSTSGGLGYSAGDATAKREMSGAVGRYDGDLDALVRESFGWTSLNFHSGFDEAIRLVKVARDERDQARYFHTNENHDRRQAEAEIAALKAERDEYKTLFRDANAGHRVVESENAALRARVEDLRVALDSLIDNAGGYYPEVKSLLAFQHAKAILAGGTAAQESAGTWRDLPPETLERARAAKTLERIPVIQDDATHEAMATLEESESAGECGGSYYTVTDHEVSEYPCPSCGRWIAVQIDPVGQGYYLARHDKAQESAGG